MSSLLRGDQVIEPAVVRRWAHKALRISALSTIGLLGVIAAVSEWLRRVSAPVFELEELSSFAVPDSFPVAGVVPSPAGEVFFYSNAQPYVMTYSHGTLAPLGQEVLSRPVGIAADRHESSVTVIDGDKRALLTFRGGTLRSQHDLAIDGRAELAVRSSEHWFVLSRDSSNRYCVIRLDSAGLPLMLHDVGVRPMRGLASSPPHLSLAGPNLIIAFPEAPFRTLVLDPHGSLLLSFELGRPDGVGTTGTGPQRWIAVSTILLADHFVQTLADVRSDLRQFAVFDGQGHLVSRVVLDLAMGVAAPWPGDSLLLVVRRTG